jgi:hypothetical protein
MSSAIPVFEPEAFEMVPKKKRRGVTVITQYGRALTFGVSRDRTERMLESMALHKNHELTSVMQEHKAAQLKTGPVSALKQ